MPRHLRNLSWKRCRCYILGSESVDLKAFSKGFHETLGGKGGGKSEMIQGTVSGSEEMIRSYMESAFK